MKIIFVKKSHDDVYEVGEGISRYTPYTTHYVIDDEFPYEIGSEECNALLIMHKKAGSLPPNCSFPDPLLKRKL